MYPNSLRKKNKLSVSINPCVRDQGVQGTEVKRIVSWATPFGARGVRIAVSLGIFISFCLSETEICRNAPIMQHITIESKRFPVIHL